MAVQIIRPRQRILVPVFGVNVFGQRTPAAAGGNWWEEADDCVVAYQAVDADDLTDSYTNLFDPGTNDAAPGTAPSWAASTGWTFNGSTTYLTTGYTHASGVSVFVQIANAAATSNSVIGLATTAGRLRIFPRFSNTLYCSYDSSLDTSTYGAGVTDGNIGLTPSAVYVDGSARSGTPAGNATAENIVIGNDGGGNFFSGDVLAVWIGSSDPGSTEASALATAMAAL